MSQDGAPPDDDKIVPLFPGTYRDGTKYGPRDPDDLLEKAKGQLDDVVILGVTKDGCKFFSASNPDSPSAIYMMERAKFDLFNMEDDMADDEPPGRGSA